MGEQKALSRDVVIRAEAEVKFYAELIGNLMFYREKHRIRQLDMAKHIGCTRSQVANIETLRARITAIQIERWCSACGVTVVDVWPLPAPHSVGETA